MGEEATAARRARHGLLATNAAVVLFGLAGVLGKLTALPAAGIVLGRVVFAGAALAVVALALRLPLRPSSRRDAALLVGQGALLALHWTAFFQAIVVSSVAIGLLAFSTFPLFTVLFEPLLLGQRRSTVQIVAALLVLPGIALLVPTPSLASTTTQGVLWGVLAGATFALLSVLNRGLGRRYPSIVISLYQDAVAAVVLLPVLLVVPVSAFVAGQTLLVLALLGLACTVLAHTLFISGLRGLTAQRASLFAALEPVWGVLFAALLLGEHPAPRTLLGGVVIVMATMLPALVPRESRSA